METPGNVSREARRRGAVALYTLLALALVPTLAVTTRAGDWSDPVLIVALCAMAVVSYLSAVRFDSGVRWDAGAAIALIALVGLGPLPAFLIWVVPELVDAVVLRRRRLLRPGTLIKVAAMGWPLLAAAAALHLGSSIAAVWLAGQVLNLGNQALALRWARLWQRQPDRVLASLRSAAVGDQILLALGVLTAALMARFGYAALLTFSVIVLIPRATIALLARARSVARLSQPAATAVYGRALGAALGYGRDDRNTLLAVLAISDQHEARLRQEAFEPWAPTKILVNRFTEIMSAAWMMRERWDGSGPAHVRGEAIPHTARVASVAQAWSALTADGGPRLSHEQALAQLRAQSGTRLDPAIVETMAEVIELERCLTAEPACRPRVHRLPVPGHWRESLALRVGDLAAGRV
jgi:hypothetical protein